MTTESARCGELTELVTDHVFRNQYGYVLAAVVHANRQPDHIRRHHRPTRPGLDRAAVVLGDCLTDLGQQMVVDKGTFSQRTWHVGSLLPVTWRRGDERSCRW